jgi:hypothetical protein
MWGCYGCIFEWYFSGESCKQFVSQKQYCTLEIYLDTNGEKPGINSKKEKITIQTSKGRGLGFASMSAEKKREVASKGGKAAHAIGTAHTWTSEEA